MSEAVSRKLLLQILRRRSVLHGEFTLASGKTSNIYVDARLTTLHGPALPLVGRLMLARMEAHGWRPDAVGGLTMGADPVVCAVAYASTEMERPMDGFLIRKEAKGHGRGRFIEGVQDGAGLSAVILEDTSTTGGSALRAVERAREFGFRVLGALSVVDRAEGAREAVEAAGIPFDSLFTLKELIEA